MQPESLIVKIPEVDNEQENTITVNNTLISENEQQLTINNYTKNIIDLD